MNKLIFMAMSFLALCVTPSQFLQAVEVCTFNVGGTSFIIKTPTYWMLNDKVQTPFHCSYTKTHIDESQEKSRQCLFMFEHFEEPVDELHLWGAVLKATEALYGENVWAQPNYVQASFLSENGILQWAFDMKGTDEVDCIAITAYPASPESQSCICVVFITKLSSDFYISNTNAGYRHIKEECEEFGKSIGVW